MSAWGGMKPVGLRCTPTYVPGSACCALSMADIRRRSEEEGLWARWVGWRVAEGRRESKVCPRGRHHLQRMVTPPACSCQVASWHCVQGRSAPAQVITSPWRTACPRPARHRGAHRHEALKLWVPSHACPDLTRRSGATPKLGLGSAAEGTCWRSGRGQGCAQAHAGASDAYPAAPSHLHPVWHPHPAHRAPPWLLHTLLVPAVATTHAGNRLSS